MSSRNFEEIFPNSPLNEVAFEIRFPANLSIEGEIYKFHEKIKTEFPIFKEGEETTSKVRVRDFVKNDEIIIRVQRDRFTILTEKYKLFEDFFPIINEYTNLFISIYDINEFNRIGLRYINNINLGDKPIEFFEKYLISTFNEKLFSFENLKNFMLEIRLKSNSNFITSRSGIVTLDNKNIYILDFDGYCEEKTSNEKVYDILNVLHEEVIKEFHSHVKDDYLDIMRE